MSRHKVMEVATADSVLIAIPKKDTTFQVEVPRPRAEDSEEKRDQNGMEVDAPQQDSTARESAEMLVFELHGSQFQNKAIDRATKKFKTQRTAL